MSWARVRREFEALCDLPAATRDERLRQIASTDGWLANELRALFAQADAQTSFLERALPDGAPTRGAALAAPGQRIGRFELVRPLGSGGMGAVWQARQSDPDRDVAIKLVARAADSVDARWRFRHEVQVLARLAHPAIASLFEAGEADLGGSAVAWFAMELVDGAVDLLTWARQTHAPVTERIAMFERLCDAVDYGHRHGVLHRDLKPGNVLVGRDGRLKLIDFGVARALDVDTTDAMQRTAAGEVVGTLQYMSPEQLRADANAIGTPCDVYALGVLLYHLLCDRPPFDLAAIGFAGFVAAVLEQEPASPFAARPDLPPDLGWIALRALAKVPERRYATVRELVDDLHRFRRHEPVHARAPDRWYRCRKFVRRHRTALTVATTATIAIGIGIAFLLQGLAEARSGLREARRGTALSRETTAVTVAMFDAIDDTEESRDLRVHQLLDAAEPAVRAAEDPSVEFTIRNLRARIYARLQRFDSAAREFERAAELAAGPARHEVLLQADDAVAFRAYFGTALIRSGQRERGEAMLRAAVEAVAAPPAQPAFGRVYGEFCKFLARISAFEEQYGAAEQMCRWAERHGDRHAELEAKQFLADAACGLGRFEQAIPWAEAVYRANEVAPGSLAEADCAPLANYVRILAEAGKFELAEPLYPELVATMKRVFGPTHDSTLTVLTNYCEVLRQRGKPDEALASLREVVASYEARSGPPTLEYLGAVNNLGMTLNLAGRFAEAEPHLRRAAELATSLLDARDPNGPMIRFNHAGCLAWMKQWQAAEPALLAEYDKVRLLLPPGHAVLDKFHRTIADAYKANGFPEQAATWRAK